MAIFVSWVERASRAIKPRFINVLHGKHNALNEIVMRILYDDRDFGRCRDPGQELFGIHLDIVMQQVDGQFVDRPPLCGLFVSQPAPVIVNDAVAPI